MTTPCAFIEQLRIGRGNGSNFWPKNLSLAPSSSPDDDRRMAKQPDERSAAGPARRVRVVVGGRVEIEREIVRLCAQRHFDQTRFDALTRRLDRPSKPALRVVTTGHLLPPVLHED